ncbi:hypothetical protein AAG570_004289 [Ranatra chinensis]|uniref:DUF4745 domain-containing protein n=1 Tax=Ranatra chinensis TaxID=642074 RepID=A0ABD0Y0G8_9HEMI
MKKSGAAGARGKPPSVRNPSYHLASKTRSHLNVERPPYHLPSLHLGPERLISMSEGPEIYENTESIPALNFASKEITECMANWLSFLKVLKTLCTTGCELSDSITALSRSSTTCKTRSNQCKAMWEHLVCSVDTAAAIVRNQTIASLQEAHIAPDIDLDQSEINQHVVCSSLLRLVNLQYQFSAACCDWLSGMSSTGCRCAGSLPHHVDRECDAVARCFLRPPNNPSSVGHHNLPQRRWSEAAAAAPPDGKPLEAALRRWSIPWKLALPTTNTAERSRSTTPDTVWHTALASQEELQDVISLLSCRPANPNSHHLPGVVLTKAVDGQNSEVMPRGLLHRASWWGEGDELDVATLTSRKSSSSTDSSSCYSLHSRSTSGSEELTHGQRSHLYSMWSGSDLPFIKLPESSENNDA